MEQHVLHKTSEYSWPISRSDKRSCCWNTTRCRNAVDDVDSIRQRVVFQQHDLLSLREIGQEYSLVLCKNVLLHFQAPERIAVLRMFHRALAPGGLFASELTQEMPPELAPLFERAIPHGPVFRKVEGVGCGS